jgi:hypothetical protein
LPHDDGALIALNKRSDNRAAEAPSSKTRDVTFRM